MKDLGALESGFSQDNTAYSSNSELNGYEGIHIAGLRRNLELCLERLPTLLKVGLTKSRPSETLLPKVLSHLRALSLASETNSVVSTEERLPETMGYVLQQASILFHFLLFSCLFCCIFFSNYGSIRDEFNFLHFVVLGVWLLSRPRSCIQETLCSSPTRTDKS